jgi:hypothetical protein
MGYITRLDAVNEMLLAAGESLVSDLEESSGIDTEVAEFMLKKVTNEFQMRGIAGNKYIKKLKPDTNLRIVLPSDCLSVDLLSHHVSDNSADGYDGYVIETGIRGEPNGYLYNVTEQTEYWDAGTEYTIEIVQRIRWEDMDTAIQQGIISSATRWYQMITQGDGEADQYLAQKEMRSMAKGRASDIRHRRRNILNNSLINRDRMTSNDPSRFRFWNFRG